MTPLQRTYAIARDVTDAQQDVIKELRDEISILREQIETRDRHMNVCRGRTKCPADETLAVWLKGFIRLDDPVVTALVEALECYADSSVGQPKDYDRATKALSAYDARVKEVGK